MKFHLHTDIGHDPDDVVALCYLIENDWAPTSISITPGYGKQYDIVHRIFKEYNIESPPIYSSKVFNAIVTEKEMKYNPGPHKVLINNEDRVIFNRPVCNIECDNALIIGPPLNLGSKLIADRLVFQGGYSPNSIVPLEKFKGQMSVQSFNPSGARSDFLALRDSKYINRKYYVGKNVCHGFTKADLGGWSPTPKVLKDFYCDLPTAKAVHDVLAVKMLIDTQMGVWEKAKPVFRDGLKMSTEYTDEEIYTLTGLLRN